MGGQASLILGVLFGAIGLGYCIYGKKQRNPISLVAGVCLMVVPYFIDNNYVLIVVGLVLMFTPKFINL